MFFLYNIFGFIIIIFSPIILLLRIFKKKEDPKRFKEKFCIFSKNKGRGKLIWIHGSSVGEITSVIPLISQLEKDNKINKILVTSSTTSSSLILSNFRFKKIIHQYFPLDINLLSKKFLNYWKPDLAIFVESEIWPNMICNLDSKKIPIILINARITKKTYQRWMMFKKFSLEIFSKINLALPQNRETLKYLKLLGVKKIKNLGNLKFSTIKNIKKKILINKKKFIGNNVWTASSTHDGEEIKIAEIHKNLKLTKKDLITIIIPRHINRIKKIIHLLKELNLNYVIHSSGNPINKHTDIYLVDTYGETEKFYSISKVVFLGGSLIKHGGQNPLEPARNGCKIIHGPHINNFKEVYKLLSQLKISKKINNKNQITSFLKKELKNKKALSNNIKLNLMGTKILNNNLLEIKKYI